MSVRTFFNYNLNDTYVFDSNLITVDENSIRLKEQFEDVSINSFSQYKFNDNTAFTVRDQINNNDLTLFNTLWLNNDKRGKVLFFNGVDSFGDSKKFTLPNSNNYTTIIRILPTVLNKEHPVLNGTFPFHITIGSSNQYLITINHIDSFGSLTQTILQSGVTADLIDFHKVAINVFKGGGLWHIELYVDNNLEDSGNFPDSHTFTSEVQYHFGSRDEEEFASVLVQDFMFLTESRTSFNLSDTLFDTSSPTIVSPVKSDSNLTTLQSFKIFGDRLDNILVELSEDALTFISYNGTDWTGTIANSVKTVENNITSLSIVDSLAFRYTLLSDGISTPVITLTEIPYVTTQLFHTGSKSFAVINDTVLPFNDFSLNTADPVILVEITFDQVNYTTVDTSLYETITETIRNINITVTEEKDLVVFLRLTIDTPGPDTIEEMDQIITVSLPIMDFNIITSDGQHLTNVTVVANNVTNLFDSPFKLALNSLPHIVTISKQNFVTVPIYIDTAGPQSVQLVKDSFEIKGECLYDSVNQKLSVVTWLESLGQIVTEVASAKIIVRDATNLIVTQVVSTTPTAQGIFLLGATTLLSGPQMFVLQVRIATKLGTVIDSAIACPQPNVVKAEEVVVVPDINKTIPSDFGEPGTVVYAEPDDPPINILAGQTIVIPISVTGFIDNIFVQELVVEGETNFDFKITVENAVDVDNPETIFSLKLSEIQVFTAPVEFLTVPTDGVISYNPAKFDGPIFIDRLRVKIENTDIIDHQIKRFFLHFKNAVVA